MARRLRQRLVLWIAFVAAILSARVAAAAIVPACEDHQLSRMPIEWIALAASEVSSLAPAGDSEAPDVRVAAMCDVRGASMVAPPRVLPIVDARIEAVPRSALDVFGPSIGPSAHELPVSGTAFALAEQAWLGGEMVVPPARCELLPPYPVASGEVPAGVTRGIERPPR